MKSFIGALIIVVCVIILISINAYFSAKVTDELFISLEDLKSAQSEEAYDAFASKWNKHATFFTLTVARGNVKKVESAMSLISHSFSEDNRSDFIRGLSEIECAIYEIADFSAFKFTDVL